MTSLGTINPKAMATMINSAVAPSTIVPSRKSGEGPGRRRNQVQQAAGHAEDVDAGNQRHDRSEGESRKRHAQAIGDRRDDTADHKTGDKRAGFGTAAAPSTIDDPARRVCEHADERSGMGSMRHGMAKNVP